MKLLDIVLALLLLPCAIVAQDKKTNYITTRRVIADGDTLTTIEYFDGLGRSSEVVQKGFSGGGFMDLVSLTEYDGMGSEVRKWNPAPIGSTGGYIAPVVFREEARNFSDDWSPYSEYEYDKTFDNRVTKEVGPGYAWHVKGKAREVEYGGIATMKYPVFTLSSDKKTFTFKRYFSMYDLSMVRMKDEDGITTTKYYNVLNQPVVEEKGDNSATYYIYDTSGNLVYVLPPAAYASCLVRGEVHSVNTDDCLQKYAYFYRYDGKNRCIEKKLPGCEPIKMIYDKENRMIFKQDGNLRKTGEWQFLLYDSYGRPTVRGVCKNADKLDIANTQVVSRFSTTGEYAMYNANISLDVSYLLKVNYYGHYAFLGNSSLYHYQIQDGYDKDIYNDGNKVTEWGLLTGCRTYLLGRYRLQTAKDGLLESLYYNNEGEVVQVHKGVNYDDGEEGYRDNATLEYDGNQLVHVSNDGFKDSSRDTQISDREYDNVAEFGYDANGNMTRNLNKGILKVTYNVLNLPESIYMRSNQYVYNVYDGDGNKLSSERHTCKYNLTVPESGTIQGSLDTLRVKSGLLSMDYPEMTVYDGDFVYRTELVDMSKPSLEGLDTYALGSKYSNKLVLSRINFEDGYAVPRKSKFQVYDYVKDYLGNVRFVETNNRVIETNNYYPFGGFYGDDDNALGQNWKFGNKEFLRMFGEYDFGGRWLDPTEGRFNSMDKYAEKYYCISPYIYCKANPIANIDPSGNYILPSLFISNDQRYSIPYRSLKKFMNAMVDFGKTTFGKKLLADFLPVGYKQYGVSGNGKFADCGLHFIEDNTYNNAKMINGKLYYKESQGTMEVKVYVDCRNMSQAQILETVVHELTLHGYDIEERLNDYKNKKRVIV